MEERDTTIRSVYAINSVTAAVFARVPTRVYLATLVSKNLKPHVKTVKLYGFSKTE